VCRYTLSELRDWPFQSKQSLIVDLPWASDRTSTGSKQVGTSRGCYFQEFEIVGRLAIVESVV
jgi:hypothetical protein